MCECGCSSFDSDYATRIGETGVVLSAQRYPGCPNCQTPAGVVVSLFDEKGVDNWLTRIVETTVTPDENGGEDGHGIPIPMFGARDLAKVAKQLEAEVPFALSDYDTLADILHDHGDELIARAMRHCWDEFERNQARARKAGARGR